MKRNMLAVIILALVAVNLVLSGITMFSVIGTNQKTAAVIDKISTRIDFQAAEAIGANGGAATVSIDKTAVYSIADTIMIPLKVGDDGKNHYYQVNIALSLNMEDEGYKKYFEGMSEKEGLIKDRIINVIGAHTLEELQVDQEGVKAEVLASLQALYNSSFIYQVSFSNVLFQ
ncbi:MAG: flagellar basal body-associated FliL family protein [Lachnospiraceae bacterium]|nr:flagellar basal body-associated FliL family protein [Lachnospiraceae bacterium]